VILAGIILAGVLVYQHLKNTAPPMPAPGIPPATNPALVTASSGGGNAIIGGQGTHPWDPGHGGLINYLPLSAGTNPGGAGAMPPAQTDPPITRTPVANPPMRTTPSVVQAPQAWMGGNVYNPAAGVLPAFIRSNGPGAVPFPSPPRYIPSTPVRSVGTDPSLPVGANPTRGIIR
jgi:hypothetical protein